MNGARRSDHRAVAHASVALQDGDKKRALELSSRAAGLCPADAEAGGMADDLRAEQTSGAKPK